MRITLGYILLVICLLTGRGMGELSVCDAVIVGGGLNGIKAGLHLVLDHDYNVCFSKETIASLREYSEYT